MSEPIYTDDSSDRMDIIMFAGDFDSTAVFASIEKQVNENKNHAIESGLVRKKNGKK